MAKISTIDPNKRWNSSDPAYNAGVVKLRCKINAECPFSDAPYYDTSIVFNGESIKIFPSDLIKMFGSVSNLEGIYLRPIYNYRHMFVAESKDSTTVTASDENGNTTYTRTYKTPNTQRLEPDIYYGDDPPYVNDYTWIISDSFFQSTPLFTISDYDKVYDIIGNDPCFNHPVWQYTPENKRHVQSNDGEVGDLKRYTSAMTQFLRQSTSASCAGKGVHWKLTKKTPMRKGQDFFIEFVKKAISDDVAFIKLENAAFQGLSADKYSSIDVRAGDKKVNLNMIDTNGIGVTLSDQYYINNAVRDSTEAYDLTNQAYYCIEMGDGTDSHYMIMLTQRSSPTFIEILNANSSGEQISVVHSILDGVSSAKLLESDSFRMTFRNHLGRLVINFEVDGEVIPWVITRKRPVLNTEILNSDGEIDTDSVRWEDDLTLVPEGNMAIFGGNMLMSFSFGYLQYVSSKTLIMPPTEYFSMPLNCVNKRALLSVSDATDALSLYNCDADKVVENSTEKNINYLKTNAPLRAASKDIYSSIIECEYQSISQDEENSTENYKIQIKMTPGSYQMNGWLLSNAKTPILTIVRILGDKGDSDLWEPTSLSNEIPGVVGSYTSEPLVLSDNIVDFSETWNSENLTSIKHSATLTFLFFPELPEYNVLKNLYNRAFYVQVEVAYGGRDNGSYTPMIGFQGAGGDLTSLVFDYRKNNEGNIDGGLSSQTIVKGVDSIPANDNTGCNYTRLQGNTYYRLITGICYGGEITYEHGKRVMVCKIYDYTKVLEDQVFLNSPFFDGYNDAQTLNTIFEMASFKDGNQFPKNLLSIIASRFNKQNIGDNYKGNNYISLVDSTGRRSTYKEYYLPDSYDKLQNPFFKFKDGENYWQGVTKICETSGQVGFFDEYGVFHYEKDPAELYRNKAFSQGVGSSDTKSLNGASNPRPIFKYTWDPGTYEGQMIFNKLETTYGVIDIYNTFKVTSASPNGELLISDRVNRKQITDPNSVGFLGYEKLWWQTLPLGSQEATENLVEFNNALFTNPPRVWKFETQGIPLRPKDIIQVNGEVFSVVNVSNSIDASKNLWWQNIECEWFEITPPVRSRGIFE